MTETDIGFDGFDENTFGGNNPFASEYSTEKEYMPDLTVDETLYPIFQEGNLLDDRFVLRRLRSVDQTAISWEADEFVTGPTGKSEFLRKVDIRILPRILLQSDKAMDAIRKSFAQIQDLHHPNILVPSEMTYSAKHKCCYFVMEFFDGVTLDVHCMRIIEESRKAQKKVWFDDEKIVRCMLPVAEALDYAHETGISHGDIAPSCILVNPSGEVRVIHFGIRARILESLAELGVPNIIIPSGEIDRRVFSILVFVMSLNTKYIIEPNWRERYSGRDWEFKNGDQYVINVLALMLNVEENFESNRQLIIAYGAKFEWPEITSSTLRIPKDVIWGLAHDGYWDSVHDWIELDPQYYINVISRSLPGNWRYSNEYGDNEYVRTGRSLLSYACFDKEGRIPF